MPLVASAIPRRELLAYRAEFRTAIFRQIHLMLERIKATDPTFKQRQVAGRLDMDEGQLSRILKGEQDLRLETLSDLARALDCRFSVELEPLDLPKPRPATLKKRAAEISS